MPEPALSFPDRIKARFGERVAVLPVARGETTIEVAPTHWVEVVQALRDEGDAPWVLVVEVDPDWYQLKGSLADEPCPPASTATSPRVWTAGALNSAVGGLAIEPSTRRRMRLNGEAFEGVFFVDSIRGAADEDGLILEEALPVHGDDGHADEGGNGLLGRDRPGAPDGEKHGQDERSHALEYSPGSSLNIAECDEPYRPRRGPILWDAAARKRAMAGFAVGLMVAIATRWPVAAISTRCRFIASVSAWIASTPVTMVSSSRSGVTS